MKMKSNFLKYICIFYNSILLMCVILFVLQRWIYLCGTFSRINNREDHRKIKIVAEDGMPVDLRFIDNNANIDVYIALGNVLQESIYANIDKLLKFADLKCNVFTYIPRGFLDNKGQPTEKSFAMDIKAIGDFLKTRKTRKFAFGYSFGCSIVLKLAMNVNFEKIVLSNPFASLRGVVKAKKLFWPISFVLVDTWDNISCIKKIKTLGF